MTEVATSTLSQPDSLEPISILLVDDEPGALETLAEVFEDMGFRPGTATTGRQALTHIQNGFYNVALFDINLPDMEGIELLGHARRLQPDMKCIMVTGEASLQFAVKSAREGAYWFLRKPIDVPYVEAVVRRALDQQRLELLARGLVEHEGLDERIRLITDYLTRVAGVSRCVLWLMGRHSLQPAYILGADDDQRRRMMRMELDLEDISPSLRGVLDTGRATAVSDAHDVAMLPEDMLERWGVRSALLLPLQSGGRIMGLVALYEPEESRQFSDDQVRQAQTIAYMAAVAIQQAQILQEERDTLRTLAESFLGKPPQRSTVQVGRRYEPASAVPQIGGDYYDFIELDDGRVAVVIGDVCGKGRAAVSYIAMAKYMLRAYARENPAPEYVIPRLNAALYQEMSEECMFITMVYGIMDPKEGTFTYTNAAHPPPVLYHPESGELLELMPTGGMVGAIQEMEFTQAVAAIEPGTILALFTDGVTEARNGQEMLEGQGVQEVVRERAGESAEVIAKAIHDRAIQFANGVLRDDVAIVVLVNG